MAWAALFAVLYWLLIFWTIPQILAARSVGFNLEHGIAFLVVVVLQVLLVFVPARRGLLLVPLIAGGLLLAFLLFGLEMAIGEYARLLDDASIWTVIIPAAVGLGYVAVMHRRGRSVAPGVILAKQRTILLIAGVLALLLTIPAHIQTTHRGAFSGIGTAFGLIACVLVLLMAMGHVLFAQMLKAPFTRTSNTSGI